MSFRNHTVYDNNVIILQMPNQTSVLNEVRSA